MSIWKQPIAILKQIRSQRHIPLSANDNKHTLFEENILLLSSNYKKKRVFKEVSIVVPRHAFGDIIRAGGVDIFDVTFNMLH